MKVASCFLLLILAFFDSVTVSEGAEATYANFESPHAHSILITTDGDHLVAVNTPANSLAVYSLKDPFNPTLVSEIPVGLEPVSVAELNATDQLWVVNHVSDSISVVDLDRAVVTATIQVGDRPGDLVFAGDPVRAFVSSMTERSIEVIDTEKNVVMKTISIAGNDPRSLLVSRDGDKVWVAVHRSGNQTTVIPHDAAPKPPQPSNTELPLAPDQGVIVSTTDGDWKEFVGAVPTDEDIFEINVAELKVTRAFNHIGTILFNLAENPANGDLWIANTDARNLVRFEPALRGHVVDNQITILQSTKADPQIVDLNPGLDYSLIPNPIALKQAIAQPTDILFDRAGSRAFVTSFGTDRVGVLDADGNFLARIEIGDSEGGELNTRNKRGPRALALHSSESVLYVLNRLTNSISIVDVEKSNSPSELWMTDPTPDYIREGRGYLYDAKLSGNGTVSCASCHIDGDRDGLAWDLGDPGGELFNNGSANPLHPMKGALMTQTLRGLSGERIFHWRADRPGLASFNGTFPNLMGGEKLSDEDMQLFADYMESIRFGSNPLPMTELATRGEGVFKTRLGIALEGKNQFRCVDCHKRPSGAGSTGFTGLIRQPTKAAQLRGLNERLVSDAFGTRVSGFGFGADGSKKSLMEFLDDSHRFQKIATKDKHALQEFLLRFPTETPKVVGRTLTIDSQLAKERGIQQKLHLLLSAANASDCGILVSGRLKGELIERECKYIDSELVSMEVGADVYEISQLIREITKDKGNVISFIVNIPTTR